MSTSIWPEHSCTYHPSYHTSCMSVLYLSLNPIYGPPLQIDFYYNLYEEVTQIEVTEVFDRWLILNMAGYRGSLIDRVNEWVQVLKSHLKQLAMERLDGLEKFMRDGRQILEIPVEKDNYDGLLRVMEVQMAIKEMRAKFTESFQPLLNIVELLRVYGEDFSQAIYSKVSPRKFSGSAPISFPYL